MVGLRAVVPTLGERIKHPTYLAAELGKQSSIKDDPGGKWKKFKEDSIAFSGLRVFGFMREGSTKIQLCSSMAMYTDFGGAPEINNKTIGFMGDRQRAGPHIRDPIPVIVPP